MWIGESLASFLPRRTAASVHYICILLRSANSHSRFEELVHLALSASKVLHSEMRNAVRTHTGTLVRAMGGCGDDHASGRDAALGDDDIVIEK
jgi:hypothetical protein